MYFYQAAPRLPLWQSWARTMLAVAFVGLPSIAMAEDAVKNCREPEREPRKRLPLVPPDDANDMALSTTETGVWSG